MNTATSPFVEPEEGPGPLTATRLVRGQFCVTSDWNSRKGTWERKYVEFSGYSGEYNPAIFAAAPDLLAAVKEFVGAVDAGTKFADQSVVDLARAALARAS